jgi:anti-sigma B factor antagonist
MAARVSSPGAGRGSSTDSDATQPAGDSNSRRPASSNGQGRLAGRTFFAATEQLDNGTVVFRVMGEVDLATVPALRQALLGVGDNRAGAVIVDLTGCTFLDSSGLRALVATRGRLERSNRRLALALSTPGVLRVFQITGLDELFEIYPSVSAASTAMATAMASGGSSSDPAQPESIRA